MRNRRSNRIYDNTLKLNKKKVAITAIIFICIIILIITLIKNSSSKNNAEISQSQTQTNEQANIVSENNIDENTTEETVLQETNPDITFTMAVTGDIMCHNTMYQDAFISEKKGYDFSYYFDDIKYHLQTPDITIGNLETTFAGSKVGYSGYPTFNTPEILAKNLKQVGFDVVSTANNHCLDKGFDGIKSTIKYLDEADLAHTGTYASKNDQKKILIKNVKGVNIAFLSFTYGTNGIPVPKGKEYCVNLNDEETILEQLELARKQNPDIICVSMHWGTEYQTTPNSTQEELADFLFENGADIILGNHPHVPQPMEKRTVKLDDGTKKQGFIIYSLGNFMANQNYKYTQDSAIINLKVTKNGETGEISFDSATYVPIYMYKDSSKSKQKFKILDIEKNIEAYEAGYTDSISKSTYNTLKNELKNIKNIIGDEIK